MEQIKLEEFMKTSEYENLSPKMREGLTHLYLESMNMSRESLNDIMALDKGEITKEEFKEKIIQFAKNAAEEKTHE